MKLLLVGLAAGPSPWQRRWAFASRTLIVHLESFTRDILLVALVVGLLLSLALLILRDVVVQFELFRHRVFPSTAAATAVVH